MLTAELSLSGNLPEPEGEHRLVDETARRGAGVARVRHATVGSGIRYDLFMRDDPSLLNDLARDHVSGQLKIAPEHTSTVVLDVMRKKHLYGMEEFAEAFFAASRKAAGGNTSFHTSCRAIRAVAWPT